MPRAYMYFACLCVFVCRLNILHQAAHCSAAPVIEELGLHQHHVGGVWSVLHQLLQPHPVHCIVQHSSSVAGRSWDKVQGGGGVWLNEKVNIQSTAIGTFVNQLVCLCVCVLIRRQLEFVNLILPHSISTQ